MIPLVKVGLPEKNILLPAIEEVLYSGMIAEGEYVYKFEEKFKDVFNLEGTVLGMSSGTAALHTALLLCGLKPGDEVITTSMTAEPTNLSILYTGAKAIFADVISSSGNISPSSIEEKITKKTKAILVVHYAGYPVKLDEIKKIAEKHHIPLIEDCAHALGAIYDKKSIGNTGDFSIFSFQAIKHLTTIDGGVLHIKNSSLSDEAKKIRWFGMQKGIERTKVNITSLGYKYNMNNVTAAIGLVQLAEIKDRINKHILNGQFFDNVIEKIQGLSHATFDQNSTPSYWLYTLLSDDWEDIQKKLNEIGVQSSKLHRPNNYHTIFDSNKNALPNLNIFYNRLLHLPCGWWITEETREQIANTLTKG